MRGEMSLRSLALSHLRMSQVGRHPPMTSYGEGVGGVGWGGTESKTEEVKQIKEARVSCTVKHR